MIVYAFLNARRQRLGEVTAPLEQSAAHAAVNRVHANVVGSEKDVA
jgi:hypothetical protein